MITVIIDFGMLSSASGDDDYYGPRASATNLLILLTSLS
jgi:hypothetical protein